MILTAPLVSRVTLRRTRADWRTNQAKDSLDDASLVTLNATESRTPLLSFKSRRRVNSFANEVWAEDQTEAQDIPLPTSLLLACSIYRIATKRLTYPCPCAPDVGQSICHGLKVPSGYRFAVTRWWTAQSWVDAPITSLSVAMNKIATCATL